MDTHQQLCSANEVTTLVNGSNGPMPHSHLDLTHLTLHSTLADLPTYQFQVPARTLGNIIAQEFETHPELPGVIILKGKEVEGAFSRRKFLERVGRPYGVEVYLKRPIQIMLEAIDSELLQLPSHSGIHEAARLALQRPADFVYEPVVVQFPNNDLRLLDIYTLLLAQSHLLTLANEAIDARAQALEQANADKDRFFSIISHDLKGPFSPLLGMAKLLPKLADTADVAELKVMSDSIYRSAKNIYDLLENLLKWALIQRGRIPFEPEEIDLQAVAQRNFSLLASKAEEKGIKLGLDVPLDLTVYGDVNLLDTVIRNLLSNALKFTEAGGQVTLSACPVDSMVEVSVSDTGIGMTAEKVAQLFQLGVKNQSTLGTAKEQGTGLGLILCKEMVEKNQGQIRVDSEVGRGTTFTFIIPSP